MDVLYGEAHLVGRKALQALRTLERLHFASSRPFVAVRIDSCCRTVEAYCLILICTEALAAARVVRRDRDDVHAAVSSELAPDGVPRRLCSQSARCKIESTMTFQPSLARETTR